MVVREEKREEEKRGESHSKVAQEQNAATMDVQQRSNEEKYSQRAIEHPRGQRKRRTAAPATISELTQRRGY